jgi:hypothetical protein
MKAQGGQLSQITKLVEFGAIKPVVDKVFPFEQTNEAMSYVEGVVQKVKLLLRLSDSFKTMQPRANRNAYSGIIHFNCPFARDAQTR